MKQVAEKTFVANLVSETSYSSTPLGQHQSTMTLYFIDDDSYFIEWDIPSLETVETIGIYCEDGTKCICDYDGVFEMPEEAKQLLQENDFDLSLII